MKTEANTVEEYLSQIPEDKIEAVTKLRKIVLDHLPDGFIETLNYGTIGYVVDKKIYPEGYNCDPKLSFQFINIASQKKFIEVYYLGIYAIPEIHEWFVNEYPKHCKYKLNMGKSCIKFKKTSDIPYQLIGELVEKIDFGTWIKIYENSKKKM